MNIKILLLALPLYPLSGLAHHNFDAIYDGDQTIEVEGEITGISWANPHVRFTLQSQDGNTWTLESNSVSILRRMDMTADLVRVGDQVRVAGNPARRQEHVMAAWHLLLPDGRELVMNPSLEPRWTDKGVGTTEIWNTREGEAAPDGGIFRVWSTSASDPFPFWFHVPGEPRALNRDEYPWTPAARIALSQFDPATDDTTVGCTPKGMPRIVGTPYPQEFIDEGDRILHRIEEYDTERTIHMDAAELLGDTPATRLGYSVGHWEGNTLVVRTVRVSEGELDIGVPLSDAADITERFTPSEDGSRLDYIIEVTDPVTFTESVLLARHWIWIPDVEVLPYDCR